MTTKADFSADEWNQIRRGPLMAGLAVVAASPSGPVGVVKEMFAMTRVLTDISARGASNDLMNSLVADLETRDQSAPVALKSKTPEQIKSYAIDHCRQVAALVDRKASPDEAEAFRQFLVSVSHKIARAAKEGGFLGIGGTEVSEQEAATLKELSIILRAN